MKTENLKKGSIVAYSNGIEFKNSIVTKVSEKFVWFSGTGYERIAKQTFINHPQLFKIISI